MEGSVPSRPIFVKSIRASKVYRASSVVGSHTVSGIKNRRKTLAWRNYL